MGRKIPAKKHRGVKDPIAQQAKRLESLKGKINAPPKDPDDQPMPRSLIRLFGLENPIKKDRTTKKNHNKHEHLSQRDNNKKRPEGNPISQLRKLPGESGRGFSLRINSAIKALHGPEEDLDYPQDLESEDLKGQRMAEQRERRARKRRRAERTAKTTGDGAQPEPHLTRTQKQALKKKAKQQKALEAAREKSEVMYERVPFGVVADAPPTLRASAAPRPGRRDLLLTNMLAGTGQSAAPPADQRRRERARLDAVEAYRALKASKYKRK